MRKAGDKGRGSFRTTGEARQAGATGVVVGGGGEGVPTEAVEDIDITLGLRARETLLPADMVDMVDICQWQGPAALSWW